MSDENYLSSIEEVIEEARNGRMFILVDDEDRENEGDLVIPAQMATPDVVNFMAKHGRGLICLSMTHNRIKELGLPLMSRHNETRHETAFTVSIEAREGVSTGISAHDRAHTIAVAINGSKGKEDIVTPGHVFPLVAKDGGVLVRAGHTEAAVDISRLAGLNPSGVICEIMNEDGTMARMPDLVAFAQRHGLKLATIRDLIAYRLRNDNLVRAVTTTSMNSAYGGEWKLHTYVNEAEYAEHLVLVKGDIGSEQPVLVRMHAFNIFNDLLGEDTPQRRQLQRSMQMIGEEGRGVIVVIRDTKDTIISDMMRARNGEPLAGDDRLRDYGIGAQILLDLGVRDMILLSNTKHSIVGLEGYGLNIVDQRPIPAV
ncbi:MAG: 3,4-dihydroxy-2-butanone-4-phosphate synthase [Sphingomonadales bacterium]|jgi:3,4-dihydroxy 2-butanone 4-phosphate synthase/GTP cyclohydrolase II